MTTLAGGAARPFGIYAVFFLESFVLGNWIPRIPDVKEQFGMSATMLGICLFVLAFGTLIAFLIGGGSVRRSGLRRACRIAVCGWALGIALVPQMPVLWMLFPLLLATGILIGLCEIAMNTAADAFERQHSCRIMSKSHGFWSLGSLAGAVTGAGFGAAGVPVATHFAVVAAVTCIAAYILTSDIRSNRQAPTSAKEPAFKLPRRDLVALCIMPIGIMVIEGAFIDWSALFVKTVLSADALATGAIYAAFSAVMAVTRLSGDTLLTRFGPLAVARVSAVSAIIGIALFSTAPNVPIAFLGALFSGLGVAIFYPLTMSAAARRPGDAADNVAAMSLFSFTSFMLAPPLIGALADLVGLRFALLTLVPLAIVSLLLTGELKREEQQVGP